MYFCVWRTPGGKAKLSLRRRTSSSEAEVNETRLVASVPPYLDIAIVFCTFVWARVVRHTGIQPGDELGKCRTARQLPRRRNDSESLDTTNPNSMRLNHIERGVSGNHQCCPCRMSDGNLCASWGRDLRLQQCESYTIRAERRNPARQRRTVNETRPDRNLCHKFRSIMEQWKLFLDLWIFGRIHVAHGRFLYRCEPGARATCCSSSM